MEKFLRFVEASEQAFCFPCAHPVLGSSSEDGQTVGLGSMPELPPMLNMPIEPVAPFDTPIESAQLEKHHESHNRVEKPIRSA